MHYGISDKLLKGDERIWLLTGLCGYCGGWNWLDVEGDVLVAPFLIEYAFVLRGSNAPTRSDPDVDAAPIPYRWRVGWLNNDNGHVRATQFTLVNKQGGGRGYIAIGLDIRKLPQQFIGDLQVAWCSIIFSTDEHHSSAAMIRKIIGKRAHRFTGGRGSVAPEQLLAFH